jgi:hypothetical protein
MQGLVRAMRGAGFSRGGSRRGTLFSFEAFKFLCIDPVRLEYKSPFSGDLFFIAGDMPVPSNSDC